MTLFKNRYRIESARLPSWNYGGSGWYFITICTHKRLHFFGQIIDGTVHLSAMGEIVAEEWQKTSQIRPNVILDEWVIMPNHFHGIIGIHNQPPVETFRRNVSTNEPKLQPNSLGAIVGQFKSICTKRIRAAGFSEFGWQTRFYDRIIRDESELNRIHRYIRNNPSNWKADRHHSKARDSIR